ncbi:MAG: DUF6326 family protein [Candidatus Acidiferrales bacterium]|jgi:hypothetical protein
MTWEASAAVESEVAQLYTRGDPNALSAPLMRCQNFLYRHSLRILQKQAFPEEVDMHDTKERLSLFWIFALLNYLYADVLALFSFLGSPNTAPHLPPWALMGSAVLMEIPMAMIVASRLLPFRANRITNIIAGLILTLVNGFLTFVLPLTNGDYRDPTFPAYVFFATIETVCTSVIIWRAWTWSGAEAPVSSRGLSPVRN